MDKEEKMELFRKQIKLENQIIAASRESVEEIKNNLVKEPILAIDLDSQKHINILNALIALQTTVPPFLAEEETEKIEQNIKKHIELEAQAMKSYKKILDATTNEKEKLLIEMIYTDESRHHALLQKIHKTITKQETLTEEEMWDILMEDATPQY